MSEKKYSTAQKKAFYSGMGYRAAMEGKAIPFKNNENRKSFQAGYKKAKEPVAKYPKREDRRGK